MVNTYRSFETVKELIEASSEEVIILLKHSNTCPVSARAKGEVDQFMESHETKIFLLIVQEQRSLSQEIAETLSVTHESPQVIVLKKGHGEQVLNHDSITVRAVEDVVTKA